MWKAGLAGAVALATIGSSLALADTQTSYGQQSRPAAQSDVVVSHAQLARLKAALKLTAEQEQYWPAVERAFRELRQQGDGAGARGFVQGISNRAAAIGLNSLALRHLAAAAYPLIKTLNDEQKQSAVAFARSIGLESIAAAF